MMVSIIIITHNHGNYLGDCLKSLLNQTYENIEIIVVDDASKDNTRKVVESMISKKIKYFHFRPKAAFFGKKWTKKDENFRNSAAGEKVGVGYKTEIVFSYKNAKMQWKC